MAAINQGKNQAPVAIMAGGDTPESVTDAKGKVIVIPTQKDSHSEKKSGKIRISKVHVLDTVFENPSKSLILVQVCERSEPCFKNIFEFSRQKSALGTCTVV